MSYVNNLGDTGYAGIMNVHLPAELKRLVEAEVASGHYSSASEVIREGLRLLAEERSWRADVRKQIAAGVAQAQSGALVGGKNVAARLKKRVAAHRKRSA